MFNQLSERSTTEGRETDRVKGREGFLSLRPSVASNVDCEESCIGFSPLSVLSGFAAVLVVAHSAFHCASSPLKPLPPGCSAPFFRHESNRDRMSVTDVNLPFCASVGSTKIGRDTVLTRRFLLDRGSHISFCLFRFA